MEPKTAPVQCKKCGKWLTPENRQYCTICEDDYIGVIIGEEKPLTPPLCAKCFPDHEAEHVNSFKFVAPTAESLAEEAKKSEERLRKEFGG